MLLLWADSSLFGHAEIAAELSGQVSPEYPIDAIYYTDSVLMSPNHTSLVYSRDKWQ